MTNFNWVDYAVLGIFFASILAGLVRGFFKELIALIAWVAAFILASMFATRLAMAVSGSGKSQASFSTGAAAAPASLLSISISFVCIFLGVILLGRFISYLFTSAVEGRGISIGNRLFGALFGLARGVLVALFIMLLVSMSPISEQNFWKESQFVNSFKPAIKWIGDSIQPGIQNIKSKMSDKLQKVNQEYLKGAAGAVFNVFPDRG